MYCSVSTSSILRIYETTDAESQSELVGITEPHYGDRLGPGEGGKDKLNSSPKFTK